MSGATLDACTIIAMLTPDHPHHRAAVATLDTLMGEDLWVHPVNLAEVLVPYCDRKRTDDRGDAAIAQLRSIGVRVHEQADWYHAADVAAVRAELRVKIPDACAVAAAWETATPLLTFDERLARAVERASLPVTLVQPVPGGSPT